MATAKKAAGDAKAEQVARSRKAYSVATSKLRTAHKAEFETLLDEAYEAEGVESPRQKRDARAEAAASKARASREARALKAEQKVERLRAELAAAEASVYPTLEFEPEVDGA